MEINQNNELEEIVENLVNPYCKELDDYIKNLDDALLEVDNLTTNDIESAILNLPSLIYLMIANTEKLGIQEDYAKLKRGEVYGKALKLAEGKVDEKRAIAEEQSQAESLTLTIFQRAYKIMKCKQEQANEILNSYKKVLTMRIAEAELSNNRYGGKNNG